MQWFDNLMKEIGIFLGICGAPAVKVSLDILAQVAQGGTTPAQVIATAADLKSLTDAAGRASAACDAMSGTEDHSVVSPATVTQVAVDAVTAASQAAGFVIPALYQASSITDQSSGQ